MIKTTITTIAATLIAGATTYAAPSIMDRNVAKDKQVETHQQTKQIAVNQSDSDSFRSIEAALQNLSFTIKGEARVFEGTYHYTVKQGRKVILQSFGTVSKGGPEWGEFEQKIDIPVNKLIGDTPLTLEIFELDQEENGKQIREVTIPLTKTVSNKIYKNDSFRNIMVETATHEYSLTGEARLFEGTYHYAVKQGDKEITTGFGTASIGAPDWGKINETLLIPANKLSRDQPLMLELFSIDQESGKAVDIKTIPLS